MIWEKDREENRMKKNKITLFSQLCLCHLLILIVYFKDLNFLKEMNKLYFYLNNLKSFHIFWSVCHQRCRLFPTGKLTTLLLPIFEARAHLARLTLLITVPIGISSKFAVSARSEVQLATYFLKMMATNGEY